MANFNSYKLEYCYLNKNVLSTNPKTIDTDPCLVNLIHVHPGVLSDSHMSNASVSHRGQRRRTPTTNNSPTSVLAAAANPVEITQEESSSIAEEGTKLSLFAQAKSVEEQVSVVNYGGVFCLYLPTFLFFNFICKINTE